MLEAACGQESISIKVRVVVPQYVRQVDRDGSGDCQFLRGSVFGMDANNVSDLVVMLAGHCLPHFVI